MRKQQIFFITLLSLWSLNSSAYEYQFLKLKGPLKALQDEKSASSSPKSQINSKGLNALSVEEDPSLTHDEAKREIARKLLDLNLKDTETNTFKALSTESVSDEKMSLLYEKINEVLQNDFQNIGDEQTGPLIHRHEFGGGVLNFSGFSWQKPMGSFTFGVNREIAPDLFSDRYIVHDVFVIGIDATSFLSSLQDSEMIDISSEALAAFAGISFNRVYHYYHFADSYVEGIKADFSKLFLPFSKYNKNFVLNKMNPYEIMKQNDNFTLNAGGVASVPLGYGLGFEAGVLAQVSYKRETTVQAIGPNDSGKPGEFLRVSLDKAVKKGADLHLALQIDFFNLLKLSILSYDLEYSYENSNKYALSFYEADKEKISPSRGLASESDYTSEFERILKGKVETPMAWHDHIVQLEQRYEENLNSEFSFLLLGSIRKKQTEKVAVIQDGIETVFFKHYSESLKFIQNFWSKLFNIAIFKIFKFDTGVKNAAEESKTLTIEYKKDDTLEEAQVTSEEDFSIVLSQEFQAASTHKWYQKKYRTEAINHLKDLTTLSDDYATMVRREELRGPLTITSNLRVEKSGLGYFHHVDENRIFLSFIAVCGLTSRQWVWLNPISRKDALNSSQSGDNKCVKNLGLSYLDYINDYRNHGVYDLMKFKSFITSFFKLTQKHKDLASLFGEENVFLNGSFTATTSGGAPFQTYFKSGEFKGLGVIDNFTRQNGTSNSVVNITD